MNIIAMLPITKGEWCYTEVRNWDENPKDAGLYFMELVFDWTLFPPNAKGKLYAEIMGNRRLPEDDIEIRLAYQQEPYNWIPVPGSEIRHSGSTRWQLVESNWFELPKEPGVSCLWIQGQVHKEGGKCQVALVTLVIAQEQDEVAIYA
jgi:hypothetical protein